MRRSVLLALIAVASLVISCAFFNKAEKQPVTLPRSYKFVAFYSGLSSADLALLLRMGSPRAVLGTSSDWLYEGPGSVEQAATQLGAWLAQMPGQKRTFKRGEIIVFSINEQSPTVVVFPVRDRNGKIDRTKHRVRLNSEWRAAGPWENALSILPNSVLSRFRSGERSRASMG
jgi:hypothetical protein